MTAACEHRWTLFFHECARVPHGVYDYQCLKCGALGRSDPMARIFARTEHTQWLRRPKFSLASDGELGPLGLP